MPEAGSCVSGHAFRGGDGESLEGGLFWGLRGLPGDRVRGPQHCKPSLPGAPHLAGGEAHGGEARLRGSHHRNAQAVPGQGGEGAVQPAGPSFPPPPPTPCEAGSHLAARSPRQGGHAPAWPHPATSNSLSPASEVKAGLARLFSGQGGQGSPGPETCPHLPLRLPGPSPSPDQVPKQGQAGMRTHSPASHRLRPEAPVHLLLSVLHLQEYASLLAPKQSKLL